MSEREEGPTPPNVYSIDHKTRTTKRDASGQKTSSTDSEASSNLSESELVKQRERYRRFVEQNQTSTLDFPPWLLRMGQMCFEGRLASYEPIPPPPESEPTIEIENSEWIQQVELYEQAKQAQLKTQTKQARLEEQAQKEWAKRAVIEEEQKRELEERAKKAVLEEQLKEELEERAKKAVLVERAKRELEARAKKELLEEQAKKAKLEEQARNRADWSQPVSAEQKLPQGEEANFTKPEKAKNAATTVRELQNGELKYGKLPSEVSAAPKAADHGPAWYPAVYPYYPTPIPTPYPQPRRFYQKLIIVGSIALVTFAIALLFIGGLLKLGTASSQNATSVSQPIAEPVLNTKTAQPPSVVTANKMESVTDKAADSEAAVDKKAVDELPLEKADETVVPTRKPVKSVRPWQARGNQTATATPVVPKESNTSEPEPESTKAVETPVQSGAGPSLPIRDRLADKNITEGEAF